MDALKQNIVVVSIKRSLRIFPGLKRKGAWLLLLIFFNSLLDFFGVAAILPLLAASLKDGFIQENYYLNSIYDFFGFQQNKTFILFLGVVLLVLTVIKNMYGYWVNKKQSNFTWQAFQFISERMLQGAYNKGLDFFSNTNSNNILNDICRVPFYYATYMLMYILNFINESLILLFVLIALFLYDAKIILILALTILPMFIFFFKRTKKKSKAYGKKIDELHPEITKPVYETVFGYIDIAISSNFSKFKNKFSSAIKESQIPRVKLDIYGIMPQRLIEVSVLLAVIIMLVYGLYFLEDKSSIIALLSIFGLAAYKSIPSINRIMIALVQMRSHQYLFDTIDEYLATENLDVNNSVSSIEFNDKISLNNIIHGYEENAQNILDGLTLEIKKGDSIGIVGPSGSGKSTFLNIMLGFIRQNKGEYLVDGVLLQPENMTEWRRKVGYVRQDVFLTDSSLAENVAIGVDKEEIDENLLKEALEKASLNEFVSRLPNKEWTLIGEGGARISGGQKQRIGIARALYNKAEVLFFDEATSALDAETESKISESIQKLKATRHTIVMVAHRLSTLKYCDRIYELKNGVLSLASLEQLMKRDSFSGGQVK